MKAPSKQNRHLISQLLATFISFGLFMYFGFHLVQGEMGYFALRGVEQKRVEAEKKYEDVHIRRVNLENRVKLLRPGSLDLDMLDERARVVIGFVRPEERVVLEK